MWQDSCKNDGKEDCNVCECFTLINENEFLENILPKIREKIIPSEDKILKRVPTKSKDVTYDDSCSLDEYYVAMINDTLREIRHGNIAYLYNVEQIAEVLRFEPDTDVTVDDGIYYVSLSRVHKNARRYN